MRLVDLSNTHQVLLAFFVVCLLHIVWKELQRRRWDIQKLPVAPALHSWIWGHELEIYQHEACEMYTKWAASVGPIYRMKAAFLQPDIVVVHDILVVQHIFQNAYCYVKSPAFRPLVQKLLGKGIVYAEGEDHKHQRRLLAPAFTSNAVKAMSDDIFACVDRMRSRLRSTLTSSNRKDTIINICPLVSACTLDIIGRVAFGHDFGGGESKEAKEITSAWHEDVLASNRFSGFLAVRLINLFPWITKLPILPAKSVSKCIVDSLAGKLLQDNHLTSNTHGIDILSTLVEDNQKKGKSEVRLSDIELLDNITTLMMVGHETSASSLIFTLLELARSPVIQEKLREEIQSAGYLDYDSVSKLEYLDAVVKEGLRLYPAEPVTERVALQDDVIPLGIFLENNEEKPTTLTIKAGQVLRIPFTSLNISTQIWGHDAAQFVPKRWIESGGIPPIDKLPRGPWAGISTFCDGPRSCIGYRLAVLELKVMIAVLVRSFVFEETGVKIGQYARPTTLQSFADGEAASMPLKISLVSEKR
ncbi:cytochrome P450 [Lentinula aciculospora]|uniref:Cytochrome P450 n=1 Tax=Lentinula aciculospora TaxID=153920 RepID=A0A9W9AEP0_9AGAR|nr:cytochrome P450 [Lentinula aciculospora]